MTMALVLNSLCQREYDNGFGINLSNCQRKYKCQCGINFSVFILELQSSIAGDNHRFLKIDNAWGQ